MDHSPEPPDDRIPLGVSTCLLGQNVRYDGGHKRDRYLTDVLSQWFRFVPICPEVEMGMGTPRESVRLQHGDRGPRLVAPRSGKDWTTAAREHADRRLAEIEGEQLRGYVFAKNSPSCGLFRIRVYGREGSAPSRDGVGLFADACVRRFPLMPVEEEGRLNDARLRESFLERVFAYDRLLRLLASDWSIGDLVRFHSSEKLLLFSHDERRYRDLGRLVAQAKTLGREALERRYRAGFMEALERKSTTRSQVNVLQHVLGHFKSRLEAAARHQLLEAIEDYRVGHVSLDTPVALMRHHARLEQIDYLERQSWMQPCPKALTIRAYA